MRRSEISFITLPVIVWQVLVGGTNERQNGHKLTIPTFFYFLDFLPLGFSVNWAFSPETEALNIYIQLYLKFLKLISTRPRRKTLSENDVQNCMGFKYLTPFFHYLAFSFVDSLLNWWKCWTSASRCFVPTNNSSEPHKRFHSVQVRYI